MPINPTAIWQIPLPKNKINLNAGTLSPTPFPIQHRANQLREDLAANPSNFLWRELPPLLQTSRNALASYLHTNPEELLLLPNVTFAINLAVTSLNLPPNSEILLTDHAYGSLVKLWNRIAKARNWKIRTLSLPISTSTTPADLLTLFDNAFTQNTRAVFLYHCSSPTGLVLPLQQICQLARAKNILTLVDGAHAAGTLPLDLHEINADYYAANLHKWLMGPCAAGFLRVRPEHRLTLSPLITAWGYDYPQDQPFEPSSQAGDNWQANLEFHGTTDRIPQLLVPEQLAFRQSLGGESAILQHFHSLSNYARQTLPLPCLTPTDPTLSTALTIFQVPPCDALKIRDELYFTHNIECPITFNAPHQHLRLSAGVFNTPADIDALAAALKKNPALHQ